MIVFLLLLTFQTCTNIHSKNEIDDDRKATHTMKIDSVALLESFRNVVTRQLSAEVSLDLDQPDDNPAEPLDAEHIVLGEKNYPQSDSKNHLVGDQVKKQSKCKVVPEDTLVIGRVAGSASSHETVKKDGPHTVTPCTGVVVDGQDDKLNLTVRVKKPPDGMLLKINYVTKEDQTAGDSFWISLDVIAWNIELATRIKKPPDLYEHLHGYAALFSFDPPPVSIKKPPDKVSEGIEAEQFVVEF